MPRYTGEGGVSYYEWLYQDSAFLECPDPMVPMNMMTPGVMGMYVGCYNRMARHLRFLDSLRWDFTAGEVRVGEVVYDYLTRTGWAYDNGRIRGKQYTIELGTNTIGFYTVEEKPKEEEWVGGKEGALQRLFLMIVNEGEKEKGDTRVEKDRKAAEERNEAGGEEVNMEGVEVDAEGMEGGWVSGEKGGVKTSAIGRLLVSEGMVDMGVVHQGEDSWRRVMVYNPAGEQRRVMVGKVSEGVGAWWVEDGKLRGGEKVLEGGEVGVLAVRVEVTDTTVYGSWEGAVHLVENGELLVTGVGLRGMVVESFEGLKAGEGPRVVMGEDTLVYHFKKGKVPNDVFYEVEIRNEGRADLLIRKMEPDSDFYGPFLKRRKVEPGGKTVLRGKVYKAWQTGEFDVVLVTNDPENPVVKIHIVVEVEGGGEAGAAGIWGMEGTGGDN